MLVLLLAIKDELEITHVFIRRPGSHIFSLRNNSA